MTLQVTNPTFAAREVHSLLGWKSPSDFTVEEIANSLGVIVRTVPIQGSEGRIIMHGENAIASIDNSITHTGKRNFVIAHEVGHFILHRNIEKTFYDTNKTLSDWYKNGPHERQANEFASELLLPSELFKSKVVGKRLNIALIEDVAGYFNASLTATFLKYRNLGSFPVMIIFIENGIVQWKQCSQDFPFQYLPLNSRVPPLTIAGDFFNGNGLESKPDKVDAIEWFPEDRQIKFKSDWKLWEQCYRVSENGIISCLWTF